VNIVIVNPAATDATLGNSITADRWANIIGRLGHAVSIRTGWNGEACDALIALHARRSHSSIERFRQAYSQRPLVAALTGTDLYIDLPSNIEVRDSLMKATRVVTLQSAALEMLPEGVRAKACVIYQSATPPKRRVKPTGDCFEVCVLSHLRRVKDPLRAALAARLLPAASRIRIVHVGRALDFEWETTARREQSENARYRWIGEQSHDATMELLASCRLFVLSSTAEGGANAIAEAVVCGIPVLCSDVPGNVGMLDRGYPGYFRTRDTEQLAEMLHRAETDSAFLGSLQAAVRAKQSRFSPGEEEDCWERLLRSF
jgi:putative glycosyltransferase (TIGR04348 family)